MVMMKNGRDSAAEHRISSNDEGLISLWRYSVFFLLIWWVIFTRLIVEKWTLSLRGLDIKINHRGSLKSVDSLRRAHFVMSFLFVNSQTRHICVLLIIYHIFNVRCYLKYLNIVLILLIDCLTVYIFYVCLNARSFELVIDCRYLIFVWIFLLLLMFIIAKTPIGGAIGLILMATSFQYCHLSNLNVVLAASGKT